jgi:hypothetical protein
LMPYPPTPNGCEARSKTTRRGKHRSLDCRPSPWPSQSVGCFPVSDSGVTRNHLA